MPGLSGNIRVLENHFDSVLPIFFLKINIPFKDIPREPECVSDFLQEQFKKARDNPNSDEPFCEDDIPYVLIDLFMAGQETTTTTLGFSLQDQQKQNLQLFRLFVHLCCLGHKKYKKIM